MGFEPQCARRDSWIDSKLPPPLALVAAPMNLAVVSPAQWHGKFVADLAPERPALRKTQVVRVGRLSTAD